MGCLLEKWYVIEMMAMNTMTYYYNGISMNKQCTA